jgi:predicted RNA-binding protein with PUA-like domain
MKEGDVVLFYHSSCKVPGIAGLARIVRSGYPDVTAWDPTHPYYDPKSTKDEPRWYTVDVAFERYTKGFISLKELKEYKDTELRGMVLLSNSRLSVQPVTQEQYDFIMALENGYG